jgi:hypothetical protein
MRRSINWVMGDFDFSEVFDRICLGGALAFLYIRPLFRRV